MKPDKSNQESLRMCLNVLKVVGKDLCKLLALLLRDHLHDELSVVRGDDGAAAPAPLDEVAGIR